MATLPRKGPYLALPVDSRFRGNDGGGKARHQATSHQELTAEVLNSRPTETLTGFTIGTFFPACLGHCLMTAGLCSAQAAAERRPQGRDIAFQKGRIQRRGDLRSGHSPPSHAVFLESTPGRAARRLPRANRARARDPGPNRPPRDEPRDRQAPPPSPKPVRNHVSNVFTKLQVADRAQTIIRAREAGLGRDQE